MISAKELLNKPDDGVFCVLPFTHMYIHSSENPRPCCVFKPGSDFAINKKENVKRDLKQEWTRDEIKEIRRKMLVGTKVTGCQRCYTAEKNGGISDRTVYNKHFKIMLENKNINFNVDEGNEFGGPLDLDLRPGNLCNLQCRMCGPSSSTQLNKEIKKMPKSFPMLEYNEKWITEWTTDENLDFILKNIGRGIRKIKFLGGEPTLMPEVLNIIDKLEKNGDTDVTFFFTSNLTNTNRKFLDAISKFKAEFSISMDGISDTLEYIRYPVKFKKIQENIITYANTPGVATHTNKFDIQYTLQAYNIHNVYDTLMWVKEMNSRSGMNGKRLSLTPEILDNPWYFSYKCLPKVYRDYHVLRVLEDPIMNETSNYQQGKLQSRLEIILNDTDEVDPTAFLEQTIYFDLSRGHHLMNYIPELWDIYKTEYLAIKRKIIHEMSRPI